MQWIVNHPVWFVCLFCAGVACVRHIGAICILILMPRDIIPAIKAAIDNFNAGMPMREVIFIYWEDLDDQFRHRFIRPYHDR